MDKILNHISVVMAEFDGLNISNDGFWFLLAWTLIVVGGLTVTYIVERHTR